jgi:hypothetical protein
MKIIVLGRFFENKYFRSNASSIREVINDIKKDLINAYKNYVSGSSAKEPILQMLADAGEPFSVSFIHEMDKMIANIDTLAETPYLLFRHLNKMLEMITKVKEDNSVREFIHNAVRVTKQSEKNYREHVKSKFEMVLSRLSSILENKAKILRSFLSESEPLKGGRTLPKRKELSRDKLLMFSYTPAAEKYGLDSLDVLSKLLEYPETKEALTTLINAIDRGHIPRDGTKIMEETKAIREMFDILSSNNEDFFEKS